MAIPQLPEPKSQTDHHLEAAKTGYGSYMGNYCAVWSSAVQNDQYVDALSQDVRGRLCDDLKLLLSDPHPRLHMSFVESRYIPDLRRKEVSFDTDLTFFVRRWNSAEVPHMEIQRTGTAHYLAEAKDARCHVNWDKGSFAGAATYLSFTLETDTSRLPAPYVNLEWHQGDVKVMMLFKKDAQTTHDSFTSVERARLGIGMSDREMDAAQVLASLQRNKEVVFDGQQWIVQAKDVPNKPALPSKTRTIQRRRSRVGLGLQ